MRGIRLSEKHGVNPTIPKCYFCGESKNELILAGKMREDAKAPQSAVWDMNPCDVCKAQMGQGIMVISIRDGEGDRMKIAQAEHRVNRDYTDHARHEPPPFIPNPFRSGGIWVIEEKAFKRVLVKGLGAPEATVDSMIKMRWAYLDDKICRAMGLELPGEHDAGLESTRGDVANAQEEGGTAPRDCGGQHESS